MDTRTIRDFSRCRGILAAAGIGLLMLGLAACSRSPPEQRLRDRIATMQVALEAGEVSEFMAGVAEDFDGGGELDRRGVANLLRAQRLRNARIGATLGPLQIDLYGERASVRFTAMLTGSGGGLLPDRAEAWTFDSGWRDGPDDWQLIHAEWEPTL
ncbi:MAG TPA: nuclear transport factor 2 family protein [Chiayiivirga sp.]|nr:nuclear transport factor 2 family protein [Chiayiivirga sp.]